jgi:hypothetical protein
MLGPIIVSSVAVGLPVFAGLWLTPKRDRGVLINRLRDRARLVTVAAGAKVAVKHPRAALPAMSDAK